MKLLVVTQAVDTRDPVLGFVVGWLQAMSREFDEVQVIAQRVGSYQLPENVHVHDLGKNAGQSRLLQIVQFWKLCIMLRSNYDAALVHMTPIWMALGFPLWMLLRKKRFLWYEARGTRWPFRIAVRVVQRVFSASAHGLPIPRNIHTPLGHGIDTDVFRPAHTRDPHSIVSVGRITKQKHLDVILDAFATLPQQYKLTLVGSALRSDDKDYEETLRAQMHRLGIADRVIIGPLAQDALVPFLQSASVFVHAGQTGLDKAPLEAMACGCITVSSSQFLEDIVPASCRTTPDTFTSVLQSVCSMNDAEQKQLREESREIVVRDHSLPRLMKRLSEEMAA